ncbi:DEAD/DEAH box helicase [Micromonospora inositola]|uniref:Superfamily II DNA or RNA helicase n=1 Tax=Micromonospora inositola TaxID=47865 RepID=A0A1C5JPH1_9ACTN|nr:hypothetical protein [Micromonospora inositola]SCG72485.1 hypothetical protein GA0070613_5090 [Micromonospora inositola]
MKPLWGYQQELLDRLKNPLRPRHAVVTAHPGTGIRKAIEAYLGELPSGSVALVLCPYAATVEQWADRLRAKDIAVTVLDSATVALRLLEGEPERGGRVLVATYARATHGPTSLVLSEVTFELIVHDQPMPGVTKQVDRLHSRARYVVALVDPQSTGFWSGWPLLADITFEDANREVGHPLFVNVPYELSTEERRLRREAVGLLSEYAALRKTPPLVPSDSRAELHARLLTVASGATPDVGAAGDKRSPRDDDLSDRAWRLLDQIEGSQDVDPRLDALDTILDRHLRVGVSCFILSSTPMDARYIADHLAGAGRKPRAVLTAEDPLAERRSSLQSTGPGDIVVATHGACAFFEGWPTGSIVISWSSRNHRELRDVLTTLDEASGVAVFRLTAQNPSADTPRPPGRSSG